MKTSASRVRQEKQNIPIINYLKHYITIAYYLQQNIIIKQRLFEYKYNYKTIEKSETNGILSGGLPQEP